MNWQNDPILLHIGRYLSDTLQMELLNTGHIASEALFNSIHAVVEQVIGGVEISAEGLFYAPYVNRGRQPGVKGVPVDVLVEWLRRKKIDLQGKREESVAFALQVSIKKKGIKAAPFIDRAAKKFEQSRKLEGWVAKYIDSYMSDLLQTMFNQLTAS